MKKKILYILLVLTALVGCVLGAWLIFREPKSKIIEEQPNNHEIENEKKEDDKQTVDKETLEESKEEIIQENQKEEAMEEARKEGLAKGLEQGREEGIEQNRIELAKIMLENGEDIDKICLYSKLPKETILNLNNK